MQNLYVPVALTCSTPFYRILYSLAIMSLVCSYTFGQALPGDEKIHETLYQSNLVYQDKTDALEAYTYHRTLSGVSPYSNRSVVTVPVVVHIMYGAGDSIPGSPGNPDNLQIEQGLQWLNDAFRNQGAYAGGPYYTSATQLGIYAVDTEIEFCLAQVGPDGAATTGITRTESQYSQVSFNQVVIGTATEDQLMKAEDFWDSNQYLNLWIVNSICEFDNIHCDIPGYAYLPGAHGTALDGVVVEAQYFGTSAANNAIAAYYFARYLNLWRTSYRDLNRPNCDNENCAVRGDRVCDTPPDSTLGGPANCGQTQNSCDSDMQHADASLNPFFQTDVTDMYENFMDLGGNPACKNTFTAGQKARMHDALMTTRHSLLQQDRCTAPTIRMTLKKWETPDMLTCGEGIQPRAIVVNTGNVDVTGMRLLVGYANQVDTITWQGNLLPGDSTYLSLGNLTLTSGSYMFESEWFRINGAPADAGLHPIHQYSFWVMDEGIPAEEDAECIDVENGELPTSWKPVALNGPMTTSVVSLNNCAQNGNQAIRVVKSAPGGTGRSNPDNWMLIPGPVVDPSLALVAAMRFEWAHRFTDSLGSLRIMLLSVPIGDCNAKTDTLWQVRDESANTSQVPVSGFDMSWQPQDCQDWKQVEVNLSNVQDKRQLVFVVATTDDYLLPVYLDNVCWTIQRDCLEDVGIPSLPGIYTPSEICYEGGWAHFIKRSEFAPITSKDLILFSVRKPAGLPLNLPVEAVKLVIADSATYDVTASGPYLSREGSFFVAGRYVKLDSALEFGGKFFEARFYFDDPLVQAFADRTGQPAMDPALLVAFNTPDMPAQRPENGQVLVDSVDYQEFLPEVFDADQGWNLGQTPNFYHGTVRLTSCTLLGLGSGEHGLGYGAHYPRPLLDFDVLQQGASHVIRWTSAREMYADQYEIIYSKDRERFESLARLDARGQDSLLISPSNYTHTRDNVDEETYYYAVLLRHDDGFMISSDTIQVEYDIRKLVKVYPNPMQQYLTITPEFEWRESLELQLFNSRQEVFMFQQWHIPGEELRVEIPDIPPGIYFFQVKSGEMRIQGKLLKTP